MVRMCSTTGIITSRSKRVSASGAMNNAQPTMIAMASTEVPTVNRNEGAIQRRAAHPSTP